MSPTLAIVLAGSLLLTALGPTRSLAADEPDVDREPPPAPTMSELVTWSQEGWRDEEIIAEVGLSEARYDLDARDLLRLREEGVSDAVLAALVRTQVAGLHARDLDRVAREWEEIRDRPVVRVVRPWPRYHRRHWWGISRRAGYHHHGHVGVHGWWGHGGGWTYGSVWPHACW